MANALLGRIGIDPKRQLEQIWRAAADDLGSELNESYTQQALPEGCRLAGLGMPPMEAVRAFDEYLDKTHVAGLTVDFARRALARVSAVGGGANEFARELFVEATAYYASRDLPSFIGAEGRIESVGSAIELKRDLRNHAAEIVKSAGPTPSVVAEWHTFAMEVVARLKGGQS